MKFTLEELKMIIKADALEVGDKLVTEDIAGKAIFEVAEIRKKTIIMVRKYCLPADYDKPYDEIKDFLNNEYLDTISQELIDIMGKRKGSRIFIPWFNEVFGDIEGYSWADRSKGKQWKIFKTTKGMIRLDSNKHGFTKWYWLASPQIGTSVSFCAVSTSGAPFPYDADYSSGVLPCFKINREAVS